ncbi:hypothetical protein LSH36_555g00001 [Paralvinella palmiformis]|uniref:Growth hormone-regulated TBC protein 1 n=1 Tax=Paralvinella palmiformis TaxID=53620 RepID=A0AAD9J767_9ANNE|nr:hypothetical protein LSH36_555g00001 [Paralvinella palmiformis]
MADIEDFRSSVDPYGFKRTENFDYDCYEQFMSKYLSVLARRRSKWERILGMKANGHVVRSNKIKRYVRKGIPSVFRAQVWMEVSGAEYHRRSNPGLYEAMRIACHDKDLIEVIVTDLDRTFPDNIYFQAETSSEKYAKRQSLFNVLIALGQKNQKVGYCQGLNFIAGLLLIVVKDEEKVFWLMDTLINDLLPDYYSRDMLGVQTDQEVLGELVKERMPDVTRMLDAVGVAWALVSTKWFICLYCDVLPTETVLRLWDCIFYEGSKVLFRVGITLVKHNRAKILNCRSFPEVVNIFKESTNDKFVINCHQFIQAIFSEPGSLSRSHIDELREQCQQRVVDNKHH